MSVARDYKWKEFGASPILQQNVGYLTNVMRPSSSVVPLNRNTDHTFLFEGEKRPMRFTNTFKSSVIPGQERDLSNAPDARGVKVHSPDQANWAREAQTAAVQVAKRDRPRSAMHNSYDAGSKLMSKSFVDLMHTGEGKMRINPTFTSQVLPLTPSTPNLARVVVGNSVDQSIVQTGKWQVDSSDVIQERTNKDLKKKSDMYKMYLGLNDTPFQRYFKEHYGDKHQPPAATNVKKQKDNIGQTIGFNQYSTNKDTYKDLDTKGRRAKEMDSCMWAGNDGNYKSYQGADMANVGGEKVSAHTSWKCRETASKHDNRDRNIDTKKAQRDNLSSGVLPMKQYPNPKKADIPSLYDQEHELNYRKEYEAKLNNPHKQRMCVTNTNWNDARAEGLSNYGGYEKKNSLLNLLNQSKNLNDPASHQLTQSFDASRGYGTGNINHNQFAQKNNLNVSNLKRQEHMSSQLGNSNLYDKFINKKISDSVQPATSNNQYAQSTEFNAKQLKQKFLEGQEDRYCFGADKEAPSNNRTDVNVHTFDLEHVPANLTVDDIKRSLGVQHLVSLDVEVDNLKNVNTGKGKITIRSNTKDEKEHLQQKLRDIGIESSDFKQKNRQKTTRVGTTAVSFLDRGNEIDMGRGRRDRPIDYSTLSKSQPRIKETKKITGKVGENMYIKPKEFIDHYKNDSKSTRTKFYESTGELFGNTNGAYAQAHNETLARDRSAFDAKEKTNKSEHKLVNDWMKMQQRFDKYASNRALQPTISRYGKNYK